MLTPQTEPKKERTSDPPLTDLGATKTPSTNLTLTVIAKADRLKPVDLTFCMELNNVHITGKPSGEKDLMLWAGSGFLLWGLGCAGSLRSFAGVRATRVGACGWPALIRLPIRRR